MKDVLKDEAPVKLQMTDTGTSPKSGPNWLLLTLPVALISFFAELGYAVINNSVLNPYLVKGLGIDTAITSFILMPFFVSEVLFKGPLGIAADHWGRKPLMVIGPALSIFTPVLFISIHYRYGSSNPGLLALFGTLRFIDGLGAAALWPAMFAYVGDVVEHNKRASAMSLLNVTYIIALAIGFLVGGWANDTFGPYLTGSHSLHDQINELAAHVSFTIHHHHGHVLSAFIGRGARVPDVSVFRPAHFFPSFYIASMLFAAAAIVAVLAIKSKPAKIALEPGEVDEVDPHAAKVSWETIKEAVRTIPGMLILAFVAFLGIGTIANLVKLFTIDEFGMTETGFGQLILYPAAFIALAAVPIGQLADKYGKVNAVRVGFITCAVGMWSLVLLSSNPQLHEHSIVIGGGLVGLGFVIAFPAWMALLTTLSGEGGRGTIIGAVSTAQGLGAAIGLPIGGFLYNHASHSKHLAHLSPFILCATLLTVSVVLVFTIIKSDAAPTPATTT